MIEAELSLPWLQLTAGSSPWHAVISFGQGQWVLAPHRNGHEFLDLCAAVELDRVRASDVYRLTKSRRRRGFNPALEWWLLLVNGALGLKRRDARGEMAIIEIKQRMGIQSIDLRLDNKRVRRVA